MSNQDNIGYFASEQDIHLSSGNDENDYATNNTSIDGAIRGESSSGNINPDSSFTTDPVDTLQQGFNSENPSEDADHYYDFYSDAKEKSENKYENQERNGKKECSDYDSAPGNEVEEHICIHFMQTTFHEQENNSFKCIQCLKPYTAKDLEKLAEDRKTKKLSSSTNETSNFVGRLPENPDNSVNLIGQQMESYNQIFQGNTSSPENSQIIHYEEAQKSINDISQYLKDYEETGYNGVLHYNPDNTESSNLHEDSMTGTGGLDQNIMATPILEEASIIAVDDGHLKQMIQVYESGKMNEGHNKALLKTQVEPKLDPTSNFEKQSGTAHSQHKFGEILKLGADKLLSGQYSQLQQCSACRLSFTSEVSLRKHQNETQCKAAISELPQHEKSKTIQVNVMQTAHVQLQPKRKNVRKKSPAKGNKIVVKELFENGKRIYQCFCGEKLSSIPNLEIHLSKHSHLTSKPKKSKKGSTGGSGPSNSNQATNVNKPVPTAFVQDGKLQIDQNTILEEITSMDFEGIECAEGTSMHAIKMEAISPSHMTSGHLIYQQTDSEQIRDISDAVMLDTVDSADERKQRQMQMIEKDILSIACIRCKKTYRTSDSYSDFNYPGGLQCSQCRWNFESPAHLRCHYDHFHLHDMQCPLCEFSQIRPSCLIMDKHFKTAHPSAQIFHCYLCEAMFTTRSCLRNHVLRHFTSTGNYECPHCHMKFEKETRLNVHKVRTHCMLLGYPSGQTLLEETPTLYVCGMCNKQYEYEGTLRLHLRKHHPPKQS